MIHSTLTDLDKLSKCTEIYLLTIWHHLYLQHLKSRFRSAEPLLLLEAANHQMSARVSCIHKQFKTALQFVLKSHCTQSYSIGDSSNATCVFLSQVTGLFPVHPVTTFFAVSFQRPRGQNLWTCLADKEV